MQGEFDLEEEEKENEKVLIFNKKKTILADEILEKEEEVGPDLSFLKSVPPRVVMNKNQAKSGSLVEFYMQREPTPVKNEIEHSKDLSGKEKAGILQEMDNIWSSERSPQNLRRLLSLAESVDNYKRFNEGLKALKEIGINEEDKKEIDELCFSIYTKNDIESAAKLFFEMGQNDQIKKLKQASVEAFLNEIIRTESPQLIKKACDLTIANKVEVSGLNLLGFEPGLSALTSPRMFEVFSVNPQAMIEPSRLFSTFVKMLGYIAKSRQLETDNQRRIFLSFVQSIDILLIFKQMLKICFAHDTPWEIRRHLADMLSKSIHSLVDAQLLFEEIVPFSQMLLFYPRVFNWKIFDPKSVLRSFLVFVSTVCEYTGKQFQETQALLLEEFMTYHRPVFEAEAVREVYRETRRRFIEKGVDRNQSYAVTMAQLLSYHEIYEEMVDLYALASKSRMVSFLNRAFNPELNGPISFVQFLTKYHIIFQFLMQKKITIFSTGYVT
jgi:hypothetical protein